MQKGKVLDLIRQPSSVNGNPRYIVVILNDLGFTESCYTKPGCGLVYSVTNFRDREVYYTTCIHRNRLSLIDIEGA